MDKRKMTCRLTGRRILPAGKEEKIWRNVYERIQPLLSQRVCYFGIGGALGFDMLVAEKC